MTRNSKFGTAPFVICHWDTFDNDTFAVGEATTLDAAMKKVMELYEDRLRVNGADRVEIIDINGNVVKRYNVG